MGQLFGATDPATDAGWAHVHPRKGFFTDTSICIGCKACEVACKEWNHVPAEPDMQLLGSSYDNTGSLGANTWRHVAFVEQDGEQVARAKESGRALVDLGMPGIGPPDQQPSKRPPSYSTGVPGDAPADTAPPDTAEFRWLMSSDVCKHCTHAGCLDVCPTGALFRTEFGSVVVQDDVCNGCGSCVAACPFGVIERRSDGTATPGERTSQTEALNGGATGEDGDGDSAPRAQAPQRQSGIAQKCTLCYDRLTEGEQPACAQTCPTESIQFGDHEDLVTRAHDRVAQLHEQGMSEARLYGANEKDGVGGTGSVFLLLDEPEVYGLPPDPRVPTADLPQMFARAGLAAAGMVAAAAFAFAKRK